MKFKNLAKSARIRAGLSATEAAQRIGIQRTYLHMIEVGKRSPSLDVVAKMMDVYNCDFSRIFILAPEGDDV
jgi:DNA-binding XRE family transcriptional regulator